MTDTTGITTATFTNCNGRPTPNGERAHGGREPGSDPNDLVTPQDNPAGYPIPPGFTLYVQAEKRGGAKRSATAAELAQQSSLGPRRK